jgi:hypothetical protein
MSNGTRSRRRPGASYRPVEPSARRHWLSSEAGTVVADPPVAGMAAEWRWDNASVAAAGRLNARTQGKGAPRWRGRPVALAVLAVVLFSAASGAISFALYGPMLLGDVKVAHAAVSHLTTAESLLKGLSANPFDAQRLSQARQEFAAANTEFTRVGVDLNKLPGVAQAVPIAGSDLTSARRLLPIAVEGTHAAVIACDALAPILAKLKSPFSTQGSGLTAADLSAANQQFAQVQTIFDTVLTQVASLTPDDLQLDPRLGPALTKFQQDLPGIRTGLQEVQTLLKAAPALLGVGTPANYLIEMMDSTELRPGGGFIGNYGILTLSGGRLSKMFVRDVDLLDRSPANINKYFAIPPQYSWFTASRSWGLRDSNLDADFPTAAQYGIQMYRGLGGTEPLQGVIALTPWLIENLMAVTGPVKMPEYNQTVTAQNLVDLIHYYQLGPGHASDLVPDPYGHSSERKRFTEILFEGFLIQVKSAAATNMAKIVHVLTDSLRSKDIQVYFTSKDAESVLQTNKAASAIQAPASGDSLLVVDTNEGGSKANGFMSYKMTDQVTLDASGAATHQLTLTYNWPESAHTDAYAYANGNGYYQDYLRVYVPPKSVLQSQSGWDAAGTSQAFGREVFAGVLRMFYPSTHTIVLKWKVPGAAAKSGAGWRYDELLQHQAGITWPLVLHIALPACGTVSGTPTDLESSDHHSAFAQEPLAADYPMSLAYACV